MYTNWPKKRLLKLLKKLLDLTDMTLIKDWIQSYHPKTGIDLYNAKREIIQEIILAGLNRGGFFKHAAFYGGTALRIFYTINLTILFF